jgi:hypothetical protein
LIARNRRRRGIGCALEEQKWRLNFGCIPRHLAALGRLIDAETNPVKHFAKRQSAGSHHFGKRLRVGAIWSLLRRSYRPRRGVEGNQHALVGLYQRQATRQLLASFGKRMRTRHIEDDNAGL